MVIQVFEDGFLECHDAAERAASDPFLGNFRKESFDLVESRSTGGREMHLEARPLGEPVFDTRGFVGRVVVHHQMDFDSRFCGDRLVDQVQELEELLLPMALVTAADHMTGGHILTRQTARSCRDEHHHAWTFRTPRFQRQPWLRAVQGLHLTFLVNAQHGGLLERTDVKPDHISHLVHEERIGRQLEGFGAMGLQGEGTPNSRDRRLAQARRFGHAACAPMRGLSRLGFQGLSHDSLHVSITDLSRRSRPQFIQQSVQPPYDESRTPLPHRGLRHTQFLGHLSVRRTPATGQNSRPIAHEVTN